MWWIHLTLGFTAPLGSSRGRAFLLSHHNALALDCLGEIVKGVSYNCCVGVFAPNPDSMVHVANMGSIWGQQDPGGPLCWPHELCYLGSFPEAGWSHYCLSGWSCFYKWMVVMEFIGLSWLHIVSRWRLTLTQTQLLSHIQEVIIEI